MARARTTKPSPAKKPPAKKKLPAALVKNAAAKRDARQERLRAQGAAAVALIIGRRQDIAADFFEVAEALRVLQSDGVAEALGRASFEEVCERDLDMAVSKATQLIALATRMRRELVVELGQERSSAILDLVDATPADDVPDDVLRAKIALPSGGVLDVAKASTRAIREAAAELRRARPGRRAGRTVTSAEQAALRSMQKRVKGMERVSLKLVAMGAAKGADVVLRAPLADAERVLAALTRKG